MTTSNPLNDRGFRQIAYQIIFVVSTVLLIWWIVHNTQVNLDQRNIKSGFDFLETNSGFAISQSLADYSETSSYAWALVIGLLNTLLVAFLGIISATIIGFLIGIARLSKNFAIRSLATGYVQLLRNIPLLLQILFWSEAFRIAPGPREKASFFFDLFHVNIRGIYGPAPIFEEGASFILVALIVAIGTIIFMSYWAKKRREATGKIFPLLWVSVALIIGLPLAAFFLTGMPLSFEYPQFVDTGPIFKRGFVLDVGFKIIPEFIALYVALSMYTAAFIAEIVRAGILSVSHGQSEAAASLGLRPRRAMQLIIIPQALRVIIPPLTSQYLNLTKNSSLAIAVGYPDIVSVGGTVLNTTGRAVEIISIWMVLYLSISLATSAFMNWFNKKMAIIER